MSLDSLLGRVLTDSTTGLPNVQYFQLIRDWEERRASRRNYAVRALRISVEGGDDRIRRSLIWRLGREFRSSDLIASEGSAHYHVLLTSPDAENANAIRDRLAEITVEINERYHPTDAISLAIELDPLSPPRRDEGRVERETPLPAPPRQVQAPRVNPDATIR
jgi:hypothetical protein